jgi:L-alanine-DL-glutamate epimerase-like enolase superfamily enzyme
LGLTFSFQFYDLPLQHPFQISRYTVTVQKTAIVCITDGIYFGYGEATVNPYYHSTLERLTESFIKIQPQVEAASGLHPEELWKNIEPILKHDYFALCAVDIAFWDFYARKSNRTLRSYWSDEEAITPLTSYTIGIDSIEKMQQKIMEKPWPIYKIKLGTSNDIEIVEGLRKITDSVFRIDANCAWNAEQAINYSKILKDLNVEFIEQPLKADDSEGMKKVKLESYLPVIADESCQRETDVSICAELFHGINIKVMKCGGITPALRMIRAAREAQLLLMAGCMTESTIGISGLVQIAPLLDYLDADGPLLLSKDIADGVRFDMGKIVYPNAFGSGAKLYT